MQAMDHRLAGQAQDASVPLDAALKQAMRALAKAVSLISCRSPDGVRWVMPATAVTPVSMEPPSMLLCMNRNVSSYPAMSGGAPFAISILKADHIELAQRCTGPANRATRFDQGDWRADLDGTPYLADAAAVVICDGDQRISYGTHDIFIGKVRSVLVNTTSDPLMYANGDYTRLVGRPLSDDRPDLA